jgi:hypothetical protein
MTEYHINRKIGNYVIHSKEEGVAPFFVKMVGDEMPLSTHWSISMAMQQVKLYQKADQRKAKS